MDVLSMTSEARHEQLDLHIGADSRGHLSEQTRELDEEEASCPVGIALVLPREAGAIALMGAAPSRNSCYP